MPNPKGADSVSACVPKHLADSVTELAAASSMSRSQYVKLLLEDAVRKHRVFRVQTSELTEEITGKIKVP